MDFTLSKYEEILKIIVANKIKIFTVAEWITEHPKKGIFIRHDIDRKPKNALKMAQIENKYNICTTYYFRITNNSFNELIIRKILKLGHEIAYHYEDLSIAKGDMKNAIKLFNKNLQRFNQITKIKTIAMHGRPLSPENNLDIWKKYNFTDYGIIGDALLSIDYSEIYYLTDTGRNWNSNSINLRDKTNNNLIANVSSTNELIKFIEDNTSSKIAIVAHSERWAISSLDWLVQLFKDKLINIIKIIIKIIRK
jgi:hypothetical protein